MTPEPLGTRRSERARELAAAARRVLEQEGEPALTMRRLGDELGMRAPSIYKHFPDKAAVEAALIEEALFEIGHVMHEAVARPGRKTPVASLLDAYRSHCVDHPNLYRLATSGTLMRAALPPGLEDWAGEPFLLATGDPYRGQALWAFAHGMVILEIDARFPDISDLDRTWQAGASAFTADASG